MSGICGIYSPLNPNLCQLDTLRRMLHALRHRGALLQREYIDGHAGIALGHVFAPTFDTQEPPCPNWHEEEAFATTLDGAIFNSSDLLPPAWPPPGDRDTTAVLAHLRRNPGAFPQQLDGHFALAVWDKIQRRLWLVRDALGGKPLYYAHFADQGLTLFASELKGILPHPAVQRRLSQEALTAYLTFGYIPAPYSIFEGIHKVFPGEVLLCDAAGSCAHHQYWRVPRFASQAGTLEDFSRRLREQMLQTIRKHAEGVPRLGIFLSGGVDSTVLLGGLKLLGLPERETFALGFQMGPGKEHLCADMHWAEQMAQLHSTRHHPIWIRAGHDPHQLLPRIVRQFDEPMVTPNCYSKYFLSEAARELGLTSCLSGSNLGFLLHRMCRKKIAKLRAETGGHASDRELFLHLNMKLFSFEEQQELLTAPVAHARELALQMTNRYGEDVEADEFTDLIDGMFVRMQGAEKSLTVQDRTSVLNGVEIRHPFHDAKLLEFANLIPAAFKGHESDETGKLVVKHAFQDVLPQEVANRKKIGYPSYYWTQGEIADLLARLLSPAGLARTGLFRPEAVERILAEDKTGEGKSAGKRTWGLLMMQAWYEFYLNNNEEFLAV